MPTRRTEKNTLYMRGYRERNREKLRTYNREYNRLWRKKKGYHNEAKWKATHPVRVNAEKLLQRAVKRGEIKRLPCLLCGNPRTVAHHPNYGQPLKVVFLCALHHRQYHYKDKRTPFVLQPEQLPHANDGLQKLRPPKFQSTNQPLISNKIYVIKNGRYYKIGVSNDPERRHAYIESASPFRCSLILSSPVANAYVIERYLHRLFNGRRTKNEWFLLEQRDIDKIKQILADL